MLGIVDGTEPKPPAHQVTEVAKWNKKDAKAQEIIVSRMEQASIAHIMSCKTSNEMWIKLNTVYEKESEVSVHLLYQQFYNLKFEGSVSEYMSKMTNLVSALAQKGEEVAKRSIITKVIMSLPEKYRHFSSAWESVPLKNQTVENLTARLLVEEERFKAVETEVALAAKWESKYKKNARSSEKQQEKGRVSDSSNKTKYRCHNCNEVGHFRKDCKRPERRHCSYCKKSGHETRDCWFRQKKEEDKESKDKSEGFTNKKSNLACVGLLDVESGTLSKEPEDDWHLDSGASSHFCHDITMFSEYTSVPNSKPCRVGDGKSLEVLGVGTVTVKSFTGNDYIDLDITGVKYVPELRMNLFSQGTALDKGFELHSSERVAKFTHKTSQKVCMIGTRTDRGLFKMEFQVYKQNLKIDDCLAAEIKDLSKPKSLKYWHARLAHQNVNQVKKILMENDIKWIKEDKQFFCEACTQGKQHREPFPNSLTKCTEVGALVHVDLCGRMEAQSIGKSSYMLVFKDDYSHYRTVYFIKSKTEVPGKVIDFIELCKSQTGKRVKILRSDQGTELAKVEDYLKKQGIQHQITVAYTPEQNGKVEREMRTIVAAARTMLASKKMEKKFWAEAANHAVYTINRTGTSSERDKTPFQIWFGQDFDIRKLQKAPDFGSEAWVHVPKERRLKWDVKSKKGIFVGFGENTKGYRIYSPERNVVTIERDVIFIPENYEREAMNDENQTLVKYEVDFDDILEDPDLEPDEPEQAEAPPPPDDQQNQGNDAPGVENEEPEPYYVNLRPRGQLRRPARYEDCDYAVALVSVTDIDEPSTLEEALNSEHASKWKEAVNQELQAMDENETWTVVDKPKICKSVDSKWVFKVKRNQKNEITSYKARLVARGFQQKGLGYEEVFAPVAKLQTFRSLLAVSVHLDWQVYQMDVCNAFLNGEIDEEMYMTLPSNCNLPENKICKLNRAIYGLKKAPKLWYQRFDEYMMENGFKKSKNDYCLYTKFEGKDKLYVLIFVDDLIITGSNHVQVEVFKKLLSEKFKMKDLGNISYYLGITVTQDLEKGILTLCQENYLTDVLERFGMLDCRPINTPLDVNFNQNLLNRKCSESMKLETKCRQAIGCLMYAVLGTRPDLCASVNILSRFQNCASTELWNCIKRVMRYIKHTLDVKLTYCKNVNSVLIRGYVDADWGGSLLDRKSTTGFCFQIYGNTVAWSTKKQMCVALSSTEAEYIALCAGVIEACWFRQLFIDLKVGDDSDLSVVLFEDNQSAIRISKSCEQPKRLKHIDIKYHFVQEKVKDGTIEIQYINTANQVADILTKPLGRILFEKLRYRIFLC